MIRRIWNIVVKEFIHLENLLASKVAKGRDLFQHPYSLAVRFGAEEFHRVWSVRRIAAGAIAAIAATGHIRLNTAVTARDWTYG